MLKSEKEEEQNEEKEGRYEKNGKKVKNIMKRGVEEWRQKRNE